MSLEATMLVLDNSSYSINGDFAPTRFSAQADAVHIIFNTKLNANPESEVGLMVMAGKAPEVLVTPTQDEGKIMTALHNTKQGGLSDLATGIQVAQLALKHRQNKNQRQRIIVFVGSPLSDSTATLVKLGKKMKKNNVAIDIISFGSDAPLDLSIPSTSSSSSSAPPTELETNETKLVALHEAVNSSENSHLLNIEPGPYLLSEKIQQSPILRGEGYGGGDDDGMGGGGGGGGGDDFGIDPNMDPELAMALRMSLEEENARQAALNAASASATAAASSSAPAVTSIPTLASVPESIPNAATESESAPLIKHEEEDATTAAILGGGGGIVAGEAGLEGDEDDDLARALALSRGDDVEMGEADEDDEDAEIARAIALSMKESEDDK